MGARIHAASFAEAEALAKKGHADEAIAQLKAVTSATPNDARAHALLCRVYATMEHFDDATRECEAAARISPNSSEYQLELARAYGAKADHAGPFTGMKLVGRIRGGFERAVQLDGSNVDALSDLGQFYVDAPGIVGGGTDKARALAPKLMALKAARGHRLLGMAAAKDGDYGTADAEFQKELNVAHSAEAYVDLANYAMSRKQWAKAAQYAVEAIRHDGKHAGDSIDAAKLLVKMGRNMDVAESAYRAYFSSPAMSAGTPVFYVHTLLGESLAKHGDKDGAVKEFQAALALAHDYPRAKKGLGQ
ncbi:MAG: tetratricopeptide repeat protein [Acidobacteria bacterium]|nr:tetratricopeptide repeat protein [Acidobacteriota bacterium]